MNNVYKTIIFVFAFLVFSTSCSEDWLEIELTGAIPFSSETIDTEEEVFQVLCASYDLLQAKYLAGAWSSYILLGNLPSDDAVPVGGGYSDRPEYWDLHEFDFTSENAALLEFWRRNYYGIYRANIILNDIDLETNLVNIYKAEAKFLRAYFYFELVRTFGNVAFYTANLSPSEYSPTNTDKEVIYAQIEQDLNEAIPLLPLKSAQSSADITRASKGAAQAMLGKIYLYHEKFDEAASILQDLISSGEYALYPEYDSLFLRSQEYGIESVFEIPYISYVHSGEDDPWANGRESEGNIDAQLCGPRTVPIPGLIRGGWGFDMIDSSLIDAWDAEGDSIRKYGTGYGPEYFFENLTVSETSDANGNGFPDAAENAGFTGWYQHKRTSWVGSNDPSQSPSEWTYDINERMIRYSDVLLMQAEALIRKSSPDDAAAQDLINQVRARVGLDPVSATGDALFAVLKNERRLELAMEGHRFWDLVRWGDAPSVLGPAGFVEGVHELLPIPEQEIGVTSLIQNNGY